MKSGSKRYTKGLSIKYYVKINNKKTLLLELSNMEFEQKIMSSIANTDYDSFVLYNENFQLIYSFSRSLQKI